MVLALISANALVVAAAVFADNGASANRTPNVR
jgi:hypothetical protein